MGYKIASQPKVDPKLLTAGRILPLILSEIAFAGAFSPVTKVCDKGINPASVIRIKSELTLIKHLFPIGRDNLKVPTKLHFVASLGSEPV